VVLIFFEFLSWALFLLKFVAEMKQRDSSSGSLPLGKYFCKAPQYEKLKKPVFHVFSSLRKVEKTSIQDFLKFLKGSVRVEHPKMDQLELFTVSRYDHQNGDCEICFQRNYVHTVLD
jgi:hypothetical protein